jgi:uncharacterized protein YutE (UPF0331/DUF86 family)
MGHVFELLAHAEIIDLKLAERMKNAVGFRNLAVHNYETINWGIVYSIATLHLDDFKLFTKAVMKYKK